jgi:hypothetical protein
MKRVENPELANKILEYLAVKYKLREIRTLEDGVHLSSTVYCRTRGYFDSSNEGIGATRQELMLFALGYGLQDVMTPPDASAPMYECEGIIYRPDLLFEANNQLVEVKTTRKSSKPHFIDDEWLPETWMKYIKGGCYIRKTNRYDLVVLYLMGNYAPPFPQIYADTLYFEDYELEENWREVIANRDVLLNAKKTGVPPTPFQHCYQWECKDCRYKMVCEVLSRESAEKDIRELW